MWVQSGACWIKAAEKLSNISQRIGENLLLGASYISLAICKSSCSFEARNGLIDAPGHQGQIARLHIAWCDGAAERDRPEERIGALLLEPYGVNAKR